MRERASRPRRRTIPRCNTPRSPSPIAAAGARIRWTWCRAVSYTHLYIARYDDTNAQKPTLSVSVGIYGYDLMAYRKFIAENPVEVQGIVKLGEVYELSLIHIFWQGQRQRNIR